MNSDRPTEPQDTDRGVPTRGRRGLLALGSAAVLAVYSAGFVRTRAAAERFAVESERHQGPGRAGEGQPSLPTNSPDAASRALGTQVEPSVTLRMSQGATAGTTAKPDTGKKKLAHAGREDVVSPSPAVTEPTTLIAHDSAAPARVPTVPASEPATKDSTPPVQAATDSSKTDSASVVVAYKDGIYSGWGSSRHGDIEASVEIRAGRIISATITQCLTRYSCTWIERLPYQVVNRQSAEVDFVSGATESTNAFYYAVVEALSKAK
jgi:uncharacterized protein with FMN-binding domain